LSLYIAVYALRSVWDGNHRLSPTVGKGKIIPRTIVLTALAAWIGLVVYTLLPNHPSHFWQSSCETSPVYNLGNATEVPGVPIIPVFTRYFFFLPILIIIATGYTFGVWVPVLLTLPVQLTAVAWAVAVLRRRRDIWPQGERYTPRFKAVW